MKKYLKKITGLLFLIMLLFFGTGLAPSFGTVNAYAATEPVNAKPKVSKSKLTLYTGYKSSTLKLENADNAEKISWKSSDKKIAKVSSKGKVTPVAKGKATITATVTVKGKKYTCKTTVTVKDPYISITTELPKTFQVSDTLKLTVKGYGLETGKLKWESSKPDVVSVSSSGKLTAQKAGASTITVTDKASGLSTSVKLKVEVPVTEKLNTYISNLKVLKTSDEVDDYMFDQLSHWSVFGVLVENTDIMRTAEEYEEMFLFADSIAYTGVTRYSNGYCYTVDTGSSLFNADDCSVIYAITSGKKDKLTENGKTIYDAVIKAADLCKGASEYETVKNIHDYLVRTLDYQDYDDDYRTAHSLYGALVFNKCVCDGYAKSFMAICLASGIDVKIISGVADNGPHAWNMVKIDDEWYQIDCTWDDPVYSDPSDKDHDKILYGYFLITDDTIRKDHSWSDTGLFAADSSKYDQFKDIEVISNVSELKGRLADLAGGKDELSFYTDKPITQEDFSILANNIRSEIDSAAYRSIHSEGGSIGRGILQYTIVW